MVKILDMVSIMVKEASVLCVVSAVILIFISL